MNTIMLVCSSGMSTSLLMKKMKEAAASKNIEVHIFATSKDHAQAEFDKQKPKVILLGPQVNYLLSEFKKRFEPQAKVSLIDMRDYGLMDGESVFKKALELIGE